MSKYILDSVSEKKQRLIDEKINSPFEVGEIIVVPAKLVTNHPSLYDDKKNENVRIINVNKHTLIVKITHGIFSEEFKIHKTDVIARNTFNVGANPFYEKFDNVRPIKFTLGSVLFNLNILGDKESEYKINGTPIIELNWNPFVYDKNGNKQYYQRDFCWSLEDKQNLIESIYNKIDCGKILVRKRLWSSLEKLQKNGETELAFYDIVDGKQRLNAIKEFIFNEYPDKHGNYYGDLSNYSQNKFTEHQLISYSEMPENTTDEEVIYQFLKMNFTGVPQSKEHLKYVNEIGKLLK